MLLEVLYRIYANPIEHLGGRSLERLKTFETGYLLSRPKSTRDYPLDAALRELIIRLYQPAFDASQASVHAILMQVASDDERAFDLFFDHLNAVVATNGDVLPNPVGLNGQLGEIRVPVSGFLNVLTSRPKMFLSTLCPRCLRAFLDGVRLACLEAGCFECADTDGFEHWVRRKLNLKGMFRWENAVLMYFQGAEESAFNWSIQELKAYRASLGPLSEQVYEVKLVESSNDTSDGVLRE